MKHLTDSLLFAGALILASCSGSETGWLINKKKPLKLLLEMDSQESLIKREKRLTLKVKEAWVDCIIDKASEKFKFDEFSKGGENLLKLQEECAEEVGLDEAITME